MTGRLVALGAHRPRVAADAWLAPGAVIVGQVDLGPRSSVWYASVLRADNDRVVVGAGTNIQDGCTVHADPDEPVLLGRDITVGHRAVLHACVVEDEVLVGMGAVVLNGVHVGRGSIVAAGSVVLEGTVVPPGSLVAGVPARVRRGVTAAEQASTRDNARGYEALARRHRAAVSPTEEPAPSSGW